MVEIAQRNVAVIGAMNEEIDRFLQGMENVITSEKSGVQFFRGKLEGREIILCKSGVGKVNAAITTQVLIDHYKAGRVIFTGVAGALDPSLDIGDIVISSDAQYHDIDASALGFKKGEIPFAAHSVFPADPEMIEIALQSSREADHCKVIMGRVLSGDQFIADAEKVKELHQSMGGACTEMEGAAVAHVCHQNKIPFVIVRSMSDRADGSAHVNFAEFTQLAAERSYEIVCHMLKQL